MDKKKLFSEKPLYYEQISRLPVVTTDQMREVDRLMIEKYGIQLIQMMENAGLNLAKLTRRAFNNSILHKKVLVVCGKGNNGGGGMVAARHLHNWGAWVTILLENEETLSGVPAIQWKTLKMLPLTRKIGEKAIKYVAQVDADVVLDALIGYGLSGNPRGWTKHIIERINAKQLPVIALDVPSGLEATNGKIFEPCIHASATLTLALPKTGMIKPETSEVLGTLYLADISVPEVLYKDLNLKIPQIFTHDTIIKLDLNVPEK